MVREKFPQVVLIANNKNVGFSAANNQAIRVSSGEYVLLLNPDTVVQEDTFAKCIAFMDTHTDAGALGIKMIDGKGNFLPESKRALPTPDVAFYKIFGLSTIFPKSKRFGRYHLSYLDKEKNHEVEILAGAYMFMRKKTLDEVGLLDETFFMYGEDIDLSYRIIKAGYKNYYFSDSAIIHYKGESTKKGSLNYVVVFYNAMIIFAKKHFSQSNFKWFFLLISVAIYLRAIMSIVKRTLKRVYMPIADGLVIFTGYIFLKTFSESIKFEEGMHYPSYYISIIVPVYILIWLVCLIFSGAYDKPLKMNKVVRGLGIGTLIILAVYALLPADLRFSRLLIIMGAFWSLLSLSSLRYILHYIGLKDFKLSNIDRKKIIIVGSVDETSRVKQLLVQTQINPDVLGYVDNEVSKSDEYLGNIGQLDDIVTIYNIDEIIFCAKNISSQEIINQMLQLSKSDVEYKIAPPESLSIIGSSSINTAGDLYLIDINTISKPANKREKRLFDIIVSLALLGFYPLLFLFLKRRFKAFINIVLVFVGRLTWVGYNVNIDTITSELPAIKKGILNPVDGLAKKNIPIDMIEKLNFIYAKDYKFTNDLNILLHGLLNIGR
jgi:GT2 family glycosyltransferase